MSSSKEYKAAYYQQNKQKALAYAVEYRQRNKDKIKKDRKENHEKHKGYSLKRSYGITLEEYKNRLKDQDYCCASCGISTKELEADVKITRHRQLVVDHCHTTGKVRGLLCNSCNTSLGLLKENLVALVGLTRYVETICQPMKKLS